MIIIFTVHRCFAALV